MAMALCWTIRLLVYGAGMGDSNGHASDPLPMVFAGGGVGKGHRHVEVPARTPGRQSVEHMWPKDSVRPWIISATARARSEPVP